jgi:hypothetical protein
VDLCDTILKSGKIGIGIRLEEIMEDKDAFGFFDFTVSEAEKQIAEVELKEDVRGVICICGHPVGRHDNVSGLVMCSAGKSTCPCKNVRAVVKVENARIFLRRTKGGGALHALSQGLLAAHKDGQKIEWLIAQKCDLCEKTKQLSPVPVTQRGVIVSEATGYDKLLCMECRENRS